jgi:hypothetical protein
MFCGGEHKESFAFFRRYLCKGTVEIGWGRPQASYTGGAATYTALS